jgi:hypothetical protein
LAKLEIAGNEIIAIIVGAAHISGDIALWSGLISLHKDKIKFDGDRSTEVFKKQLMFNINPDLRGIERYG